MFRNLCSLQISHVSSLNQSRQVFEACIMLVFLSQSLNSQIYDFIEQDPPCVRKKRFRTRFYWRDRFYQKAGFYSSINSVILLLLDRASIIVCYCLIAVQLLGIYRTIIAWSRSDYSMLLLGRDATYCTIIAWSRFDYSMLLLGRDATAPNILYYYCLVALRL
jgi:hypothetical protein